MGLTNWDLTIFLCTVFGLFWLYGLWEKSFFSRRGVKSVPYHFPLIGNVWEFIRRKEHYLTIIERCYSAFPNQRYVGFTQFILPILMLKDPELIKLVAVRDFEYFQDRLTMIDEKTDPVFGAVLVALKGQKWRDMRSTLSPAFTSAKIKGMFEFVEETIFQVVEHFNKELSKPDNNDAGMLVLEMKEIYRRYINDAVASAGFGLNVNSFTDMDNKFFEIGSKTCEFSGQQLIKFLTICLSPRFFSSIGLHLFPESVRNYYRTIVNSAMKEREEQNIYRQDMIHLLMQAKKGSLQHEYPDDTKEAGFSTVQESMVGRQIVKRKWSDDEIVAQAILLLLVSFDTVGSTLSFMSHELAIKPDIRKKLQNEIDETMKKNDGKIKYLDLNEMKYLDMVISETLRHYPPVVAVDRICVKPYTFPPPDNSSKTPYTIYPSQGVSFPVYSLHHDPQYYKDPEVFDPERFSEERKHEIIPYTYIPFGAGPRNCIGSRFGLMLAKLLIVHMLRNFDYVPCSNTEVPLKFKQNEFSLNAANGFWIGLTRRNVK